MEKNCRNTNLFELSLIENFSFDNLLNISICETSVLGKKNTTKLMINKGASKINALGWQMAVFQN